MKPHRSVDSALGVAISVFSVQSMPFGPRLNEFPLGVRRELKFPFVWWVGDNLKAEPPKPVLFTRPGSEGTRNVIWVGPAFGCVLKRNLFLEG